MSIANEVSTLSPESTAFVEKLAVGPLNAHGFSEHHATTQQRWLLEEIAAFVRDVAMHLKQLFREAEDTLGGPRERLPELPELDEEHEQARLLLDVQRMRRKNQHGSLRLVYKPSDVLYLNSLVGYLKKLIEAHADEEAEAEAVAQTPLSQDAVLIDFCDLVAASLIYLEELPKQYRIDLQERLQKLKAAVAEN